MFNMVLRDVFYSLPKPPAPPYHLTKVVQDFESVLLTHTREKGFVPHQPWIAKINQLWTLSKVHRGNHFQVVAVNVKFIAKLSNVQSFVCYVLSMIASEYTSHNV